MKKLIGILTGSAIITMLVLAGIGMNIMKKEETISIIQGILSNPFYVALGNDKGKKVEVYDGTIESYNGYFYLMGTGSGGKIYSSTDMVHWGSPYQLISKAPGTIPSYATSESRYTEYGASDLLFHNGVMFYVFNGLGLVHGRPDTLNNAVPEFKHSLLDRFYDDDIDAQFFVAHNGDLIFIRKINPNKPDPITGKPEIANARAAMWKVKSFFNENGHPDRGIPKILLNTQPGHWANIDKFNFEGPEMYYHNGKYYLLYVGNWMDARGGLYDTGVAQADFYDQFDNSKKLPGKLLSRNIEKLLLKYSLILPTAEHGGQPYRYTFSKPDDSWIARDYNDAAWKLGDGGFGYPAEVQNARIPSIYNAGKTRPEEIWGSPTGPRNIWVRRSFELKNIPETAVLRYRMEGKGKIYINGTELANQPGAATAAYKMLEVPAGLLKTGINVITAEAVKTDSLQYCNLDFGIYDTKGQPVEPDIVGPSQPNVIKGPNGFETWVVYKAFWNSINGQGKDRVYFWGEEMVADGPTSGNTPGRHFDASGPSYRDNFDSNDSLIRYEYTSGGVSIQNKALYFNSPDNVKEVLLKDKQAENLYIETSIKFTEKDLGSLGQAGITIWRRDDSNYVQLLLDRKKVRLIVSGKVNGEKLFNEYALPDTFRFLEDDARTTDYGEQYHTLKVYKNGSKLFAELDHYKLNNDKPVLELKEMSGAGRIGLVSAGANCFMDSVIVTTGWSEYNGYINGWDAAWKTTEKGLYSPASGRQMAIKGDKVLQHEFSANIDTSFLPGSGKAGMILEYIDDKNNVTAYTSYDNKKIEIHKVVNGRDTIIKAVPAGRETIYGHSNYKEGGQTEYIYNLRGMAEVSLSKILWFFGDYKYISKSFVLPDSGNEAFGFDVWSTSTNTWQPVKVNYEDKGKGDYHIASFGSTVKTDKIRLRVPEQKNRPFSFAVREEISSQNFYKTVRRAGRIYLWVNNDLIFEMEDPFPGKAGQVGFYTNNCEALYDSITCFEVNVQEE